MMKVESRAALVELDSRRAPEPKPSAAPPPAGPDLSSLVDAVRGATEVATHGVELALEAHRSVLELAQAMRDSRPKKMFAEVERDELGRMAGVVITVG